MVTLVCIYCNISCLRDDFFLDQIRLVFLEIRDKIYKVLKGRMERWGGGKWEGWPPAAPNDDWQTDEEGLQWHRGSESEEERKGTKWALNSPQNKKRLHAHFYSASFLLKIWGERERGKFLCPSFLHTFGSEQRRRLMGGWCRIWLCVWCGWLASPERWRRRKREKVRQAENSLSCHVRCHFHPTYAMLRTTVVLTS